MTIYSAAQMIIAAMLAGATGGVIGTVIVLRTVVLAVVKMEQSE